MDGNTEQQIKYKKEWPFSSLSLSLLAYFILGTLYTTLLHGERGAPSLDPRPPRETIKALLCPPANHFFSAFWRHLLELLYRLVFYELPTVGNELPPAFSRQKMFITLSKTHLRFISRL